MKKNKGFTLVELLAVIVILGILVAIAIPVYINITKSAKENELNAKKQYISEAAIRFAEENSVLLSESEFKGVEGQQNGTELGASNNSLFFTPVRLITTGYLSAEKYIEYNGYKEFPFIQNPVITDDNLACHVLSLTQKDYEYFVEFTDEVDCELASKEVMDTRLGIVAYELSDDGKKVASDSFKPVINNYFRWTKNDVILVVNPTEEFSDAQFNDDGTGNTKIIDKNNMFTGNAKGQLVDNIKTKSNVLLVKQTADSDDEKSYPIQVTFTDGSAPVATVHVRIDKKKPTTEQFQSEMWTNKNRETLVYVSDGGSGPRTLKYSTTNDYNKASTATDIVKVQSYMITAKLTGLTNGTIYVWPIDNVGNVGNVRTVVIKNVDPNPPTFKGIKWSITGSVSCEKDGRQSTSPNVNSDCRAKGIDDILSYDQSRTAIVSYEDNQSGMRAVQYCFTEGDKCEPLPTSEVKGVMDNGIMKISLTWPSSRNAQRICYRAIDNVGNIEANVRCTDKYFVDGTKPSGTDFSYSAPKEVSLKFSDVESGVYKAEVFATDKTEKNEKTSDGVTTKHVDKAPHNCPINVDDFYNKGKRSCELKFLFADRKYKVTVKLYNRSGLIGNVDGELDTTGFNMTTAYKLCDPDENWCQYPMENGYFNGVYVRYGKNSKLDNRDIDFVVYKKQNSAVYAFSERIGNFYQINQSCCDHGNCHADKIIDPKISGIWGSGSDQYAKKNYNTMKMVFGGFPNSRKNVTRSVTWNVEEIPYKKLYNTKILKNPREVEEVSDDMFSFDIYCDDSAIPNKIYSGYDYFLNNTTYDGEYEIRWYIKKKGTGDYTRIEDLEDFNLKDKEKYYIKCRIYNDDAEMAKAKNTYYARYGHDYVRDVIEADGRKSQDILREILGETSSYTEHYRKNSSGGHESTEYVVIDPDDVDDNYENAQEIAIQYQTQLDFDDDVNVTSTLSINARYGLLSYTDYQKLHKLGYYSNISGTKNHAFTQYTLLDAYTNKATYLNEISPDGLVRAYGHSSSGDISRYSTVGSLLTAPVGGYSTTTPMWLGSYNAAMVLPFKTNAHFRDGNGSADYPFVIDGTLN